MAASCRMLLTVPPRIAVRPPEKAAEPNTLVSKGLVIPKLPATYLPRTGLRNEPKPLSAADFKTSFALPPDSAVIPPVKAAAPMIGARAALAPKYVPIAGISAGTKTATTGNTYGATFLTTLLTSLHKSLNQPNSCNPVAGLIVPVPPICFSMAASSLLMCAS